MHRISFATVILLFVLLTGCGSVYVNDDEPTAESCDDNMHLCDGSCVPLLSENHCGECNVKCDNTQSCKLEQKSYSCRCNNGKQNCASDGCNIDIQSNPEHCGKCFNPCKTNEICHKGKCVCPSIGNDVAMTPKTREVLYNSDSKNCGQCNNICPADNSTCNNGICQCSNNLSNCSTTSIDCSTDLLSDNQHCGKCNHQCKPNEACISGICTPLCTTDGDCDNKQVCHISFGKTGKCINYQDIRPLKMTWKLSQPGSIKLEISHLSNEAHIRHLFDVDCNADGTYEFKEQSSTTTCDYQKAGTYQIVIRGHYNGFMLKCSIDSDEYQLLSIDQWGDNPWYTFNNFTSYCSKLHILATDKPNLRNTISLYKMFYNATSMNEDLNDWDVSHVQAMSSVFYNASSFNKPLGNWKVSNVTSMYSMFYGAKSFNQDIENWDVSNVTNMNAMFEFADIFNQDIGGWKVDNVTDMSGMFYGAKAFNKDIGNWKVNNVTDMSGMFAYTDAFDQDIGNWKVDNVTIMTMMFREAKAFDQNISHWHVDNVKDWTNIFKDAAISKENKPPRFR